MHMVSLSLIVQNSSSYSETSTPHTPVSGPGKSLEIGTIGTIESDWFDLYERDYKDALCHVSC